MTSNNVPGMRPREAVPPGVGPRQASGWRAPAKNLSGGRERCTARPGGLLGEKTRVKPGAVISEGCPSSHARAGEGVCLASAAERWMVGCRQLAQHVGTRRQRLVRHGIRIRALHMLLRRSSQREMNIGAPWGRWLRGARLIGGRLSGSVVTRVTNV